MLPSEVRQLHMPDTASNILFEDAGTFLRPCCIWLRMTGKELVEQLIECFGAPDSGNLSGRVLARYDLGAQRCGLLACT
jgi:hypothetical protein